MQRVCQNSYNIQINVYILIDITAYGTLLSTFETWVKTMNKTYRHIDLTILSQQLAKNIYLRDVYFRTERHIFNQLQQIQTTSKTKYIPLILVFRC